MKKTKLVFVHIHKHKENTDKYFCDLCKEINNLSENLYNTENKKDWIFERNFVSFVQKTTFFT